MVRRLAPALSTFLLFAAPASAGLLDQIEGKAWAENCTLGERQADWWNIFVRETTGLRFCEEFLNENRTNRACEPVSWKEDSPGRALMTYTETGHTLTVEQTVPNRLTFYSESDGRLYVELRLGLAEWTDANSRTPKCQTSTGLADDDAKTESPADEEPAITPKQVYNAQDSGNSPGTNRPIATTLALRPKRRH